MENEVKVFEYGKFYEFFPDRTALYKDSLEIWKTIGWGEPWEHRVPRKFQFKGKTGSRKARVDRWKIDRFWCEEVR